MLKGTKVLTYSRVNFSSMTVTRAASHPSRRAERGSLVTRRTIPNLKKWIPEQLKTGSTRYHSLSMH